MRSAAAPAAAFDPGDMGAEPLRGAADTLVRLAAAGGERGELAFERAGLPVGGEPGLLHRLGDGARLLLGARQIARAARRYRSRAGGGGVERLRLPVELGGLAGRDSWVTRPSRSDASSPRLISRSASSRSARAILLRAAPATMASTLSSARLSRRIAVTAR